MAIIEDIKNRLNELDEELFQATALKMGMRPDVVEKDFWVCYMLDHLFNDCEYKDAFVFKGGTSLSKSYHVIERFSEDIDLIPRDEIMQPLKNDYAAMANMFYGQAPEFEELITYLSQLEKEIHNL